jgi:hypothetical protein
MGGNSSSNVSFGGVDHHSSSIVVTNQFDLSEGHWFNNHIRIVISSGVLLVRVQYPVPHSSRLQGIHRPGSGNCGR